MVDLFLGLLWTVYALFSGFQFVSDSFLSLSSGSVPMAFSFVQSRSNISPLLAIFSLMYKSYRSSVAKSPADLSPPAQTPAQTESLPEHNFA
jgi:hypothetical protein